MADALKPIDEQVIVITGASSGIGLATAQAAAREGARVVLTARNEVALAEAARQIEAAGGAAVYVSADVANRAELQRAADTALERFGGFDTWVNNAGVSIWGRLEEVTEADSRRLFETNFWGAVNGSLIAVQHLKKHGGALINVGSVASDIALPLQGMYSASKHALKGFTDALRVELREEGAPVAVTLIKPASIDTPFPQHARNYGSREPQVPGLVYSVEEAARAILHAAAHGPRDFYVGGGGRAASAIRAVAPHLTDWATTNLIPEQEFRDEPAHSSAGSLYHTESSGAVHGTHPGHVASVSLYTRAAMHPILTTAAVLAAIWLLAGRSRSAH